MAALSYMHRRSGGVYWYRKSLPRALAGRELPSHVRATFPQLVNPQTGLFKLEPWSSLETTDFEDAKLRNQARGAAVGAVIAKRVSRLQAAP